MSRKSLKTLIEEATIAQDEATLKTLHKEAKRRRDAKNKSRRKSYRKKKRLLAREEKKRQKNIVNKPPKKERRGLYHIIILNHGKRLDDIFQTPRELDANIKFNELLKENENVRFPIQYNTSWKGTERAEYEIAIIKQRIEGEINPTLRDEYGDKIEYETNNEKWLIYDIAPYNMEETFFVYGYNPIEQRKDYSWIFENFFLENKNIKGYTKLIFLLYNKVILDYNGSIDMVICKNQSDSIRLYNSLLHDSEENKVKYVSFMGKIENSRYKRDWVKRLAELTGWSHRKILRKETQPKKVRK